MANIKGGRAARKRDRQNAKARARADAGKKEDAEKEFKAFVSGLDKAVKKGIISKNTADRKKSRAQLKMNKMAAAAEAAK